MTIENWISQQSVPKAFRLKTKKTPTVDEVIVYLERGTRLPWESATTIAEVGREHDGSGEYPVWRTDTNIYLVIHPAMVEIYGEPPPGFRLLSHRPPA
jgi:hypothetical protein